MPFVVCLRGVTRRCETNRSTFSSVCPAQSNMPPKTVATLASMLDSDDSDVDMADVRDENVAPPKKGAATTTRKPRKTKPLSKRLSGGKKKGSAQTKRAPLTDKSNDQQFADDTEEVDEFAREQPQAEDVDEEEEDEIVEEKPAPKKRGRQPKTAAPQRKNAKAQTEAQLEDLAREPTPPNPRNRPPGAKVASAAGRRVAKAKKQVQPESENEADRAVADSQHAPMDLDEDDLEAEQIPQSVYKQNSHARAGSRQPQPTVRPGHQRAGSASDTERTGDPALRRKLGDMTKKFETLQMRYTRLQDVGIKEAETNFERLRQQSQAQEQAASELIESLKAELAAARKDAGQNTSLSTQVAKAKDLAKISDEKLKASESQLASVTEKLALVQSDNKSLQAKLAATRQASHDTNNNTRVPGSAIKGKATANDRAAAALLVLAQLKEDLYGDLTGLIVRSVEKTAEADVFDCIQTGRNGSKFIFPSILAL